MAGHSCNSGHIIPTPNVQLLAECLANGQLNVSTALAQVNHFAHETLKIIGDFANNQAKAHENSKAKMDKMDDLIHSLSEKCQAIQQALLLKEEKYDEKCREVESYKMVCQMAAEAANKPPINISRSDANNNHAASGDEEPRDYKTGIVKLENLRTDSSQGPRSVVKHAKFSQNQLHLSQHIAPLQPPSSPYVKSHPSQGLSMDQKPIAQYYAGGPSKRRPLLDNGVDQYSPGSRVTQQFEMIGGVNLRSSCINSRSVSLDELVSAPLASPRGDESNKRARIDVSGQRNEILSTAENNALRMRQRVVEKDLHKMVSGGSLSRLASRRKKNWPY